MCPLNKVHYLLRMIYLDNSTMDVYICGISKIRYKGRRDFQLLSESFGFPPVIGDLGLLRSAIICMRNIGKFKS